MLISCVAYQNGQKIPDIPVEDISEYVSRPDCFVWVALFEPSNEELDQLADEFGLHELAVDDARRGHLRPKIEEYGEKVLSLDMKKFNVFSNSKNMRSLLKTMLELQSKITYLNHHLYFKKVTDKEKGFK